MDIVPITAQYLRGLKAANEEKARVAVVRQLVVRIMGMVTEWANQGAIRYSEEISDRGWPHIYDKSYKEVKDDVLGLLKKNIVGAKIEYQGTILIIDWS